MADDDLKKKLTDVNNFWTKARLLIYTNSVESVNKKSIG